MATIQKFEDVQCWREVDQVNRSSGSVTDNIAEGFDRDGTKEFKNFLSIAKSSCSETKSQVHRAYDRDYTSKEVFDDLLDQAEKTSNLIGGLMRYPIRTDLRGIRFKSRRLPG